MSKSLIPLNYHVEKTISKAVSNISVHDWDEDHITRSIIGDIRKLLKRYRFESSDTRSRISWEMYKLSGTHEHLFGDISIIVNLSYKDGTNLTGAAFLEAKKRYSASVLFGAMDDVQAKRILQHAPRANYLLYDYSSITDFANFNSAFDYCEFVDANDLYTPKTNAVCCPINLALQTQLKNTALYRHSTPLSVMITNRYFKGLDLEFSQEAMGIAGGYLEHHGRPKYIMEISIAEIDDESMKRKDRPDVNPDQYELFALE